jgi:hypothetical protein
LGLVNPFLASKGSRKRFVVSNKSRLLRSSVLCPSSSTTCITPTLLKKLNAPYLFLTLFANFHYAAPMSEVALLGVLAQRFGSRIEWDPIRGLTNPS